MKGRFPSSPDANLICAFPSTGRIVVKLTKDEIVTMEVLRLKGENNAAIAKRLGITEGAVR